MKYIIGVDGCKGGWCAVMKDLDGEMQLKFFRHIGEIYEIQPRPLVIAVDMPIGLLDEAISGGRLCEQMARKLLGPIRASSVFSAPVRTGVLKANSYGEANQINRKSSLNNIGISQQAYGIFPKLKEIDEFMTPERQKIIREIHPELCFYELNNKTSLEKSKSSSEGSMERGKLLAGVGYGSLINSYLSNQYSHPFKLDDMLDACAACWTAERIYNGKTIVIPEKEDIDLKGLKMEMWR